jgi:cytochrome c5
MIKRSVSFVFSLVFLTLLWSCRHDTAGLADFDKVCFQTEVLPVFQNSCGPCHSSSKAEEGKDFTNYAEIMKSVKPFDASGSEAYRVLTGKPFTMMPPSGPLPKETRTKIWLWIQQGAEETTCETGGNGGNPPVSTLTCFSRDLLPILSNSCAISGCHNAASAKEGIVITSYQTLMASKIVSAGKPSSSDLYKKITLPASDEDIMPPKPYSPLSKAVTDSIYQWILRGAKNETCAAACDTTGTITWSGAIQSIFQNNCQSCHSGATPSGNLKLTTYAEVVNAVKNGRLLNAVKRATGVPAMPPSIPLSTCDIRKIELWKNQNYIQ